MKTILISIHPEYCEKIFSGEKTIEIRKTTPEPPFKAVVYCTKKEPLYGRSSIWEGRVDGKVIGEFVVKDISTIYKRGVNNNYDYCYESLNCWGNDDIEIEITAIKKSMLSKKELNNYGANVNRVYALCITTPKLYEKPKELGEFNAMKKCDYLASDNIRCLGETNRCKNRVFKEWNFVNLDACISGGLKPVTCPPQNYMYIQDMEEVKE